MKQPVRIRIRATLPSQEWASVRARLAGRQHDDQLRELLNRCTASLILRRIVPYISLGRIGLGLPGSTGRYPLLAPNSPCLYFYNGYFTVSSYDNYSQWRFTTAAEAVAFAEQHLTTIPPLPSAESL